MQINRQLFPSSQSTLILDYNSILKMWIILCLLLIHEVVLVGSFTTSKRVKVQTGSSLFPQCSTCHQRYLHRVFPSVLHASSDPSSAFFGTGSSNGGKDKKVNGAEKLDFDEDFYSVLEVSTTVTPEELKKAYYRLVAKYHPDSRQTEADKELGNQQMMVINNAYRILREEETRKAYDVRRRMGYRGNRAHVKEDNQQNEKPPTKSSNQNKEPNPFGFGTKTREESAEEEAWRRRKQQMEDSRNRYQQPAADQQTYSSRTSEKSASSSFTSSKSQQSEDEIFGVGRGDGSLHSLKVSIIDITNFMHAY